QASTQRSAVFVEKRFELNPERPIDDVFGQRFRREIHVRSLPGTPRASKSGTPPRRAVPKRLAQQIAAHAGGGGVSQRGSAGARPTAAPRRTLAGRAARSTPSP